MIRATAIAILISVSSFAESPSEFVTRAISPYVISVISPVQEGDRSDPGHIFQVQTIVSKDAEGNARKVTQKFTPDGADSFVMINGLIKNFDPARATGTQRPIYWFWPDEELGRHCTFP